jgi:protein-tyrosine phosphatase
MTQHAAVHAFEGIDNFRDFGGYRSGPGRRVKHGRLYRSAHHARATEADLKILSRLDLAALVDLRRSEERLRDPSLRPGEFGAEVIDNDIGQAAEDYHEFLKRSDLSVRAMREDLMSYYAGAPFEPRHINLYSRYFKALAETDGPVLIHCTAGKDRTGILAALTHHILGVAYEDSVADYLLTNDPERIERRLSGFGDYVEAVTGRRASDDALRITMGVDVLYLDTAFEVIKARYGSVDAYLDRALEVDADRRTAILRRLLE